MRMCVHVCMCVCVCVCICVCLCKGGCVLFVSFVFAFAWRLTNECRWKRILCQWTESSQLSLSILFLSTEYANFNGNDKSLNIRDSCLVWIRSSLGMVAYEISINHSPTPNCWFRFAQNSKISLVSIKTISGNSIIIGGLAPLKRDAKETNYIISPEANQMPQKHEARTLKPTNRKNHLFISVECSVTHSIDLVHR